MPDYKAMYTKLFNVVTDVIQSLQAVQVETEEMFMDHEPNISLFEPDGGSDE